MADERARHLFGCETTMVPEWAKKQRPYADVKVIGPPIGHDPTGDIRPVEMQIDESDGYRMFLGFIRIPKEAAEQMAAEDGGWIEVGFRTPQLMPWSHLEYVALADEEDADGV